MKYLIINEVAGNGSTGKIAADICRKYIAEGNEAVLAYGRSEAVNCNDIITYRISTNLSVIIDALKTRFFDNAGFNSKLTTRKFLKWCDDYNPDVVWLHNLHGYYINVELLFDWVKKHPEKEYKWTLHDCWAFTGHCAYFSFVKCNKWKTGCHNCPQFKSYPKSIFRDNSQNNYKNKSILFTGVSKLKLITPSQWLADLVKESFIKEYQVEVIRNIINKDIFKPTKSDFRKKYCLESKKLILGVASVWEERKGLKDFLTLSNMLDNKYKIVLVGLNNKQIKFVNKNFPDILALPRTNSAEALAAIYTAADIFLNLTYEDNYPTTNLEAHACGTRCVTYRTGGSIESVNDEDIVEPGDFVTLNQIIKSI